MNDPLLKEEMNQQYLVMVWWEGSKSPFFFAKQVMSLCWFDAPALSLSLK